MSRVQRTLTLLLVAATLLAGDGHALPSAFAQQDKPTSVERPQADDSVQPSRTEHRRGARFGRLPGAHLFRTLPSDQGPLKPEEQQQLMDFVSQHAGGAHQALKQLEKKDPGKFRQRLEKAAPLLRRLRRIFDRDPQLGQSIIQHSENLQRLRRARRAWLDNGLDPAARSGIEDVMRRTVAENVEIEVAVLEDQLRELDWQRDARIEAEFERLTSAETDLAGEPPELRKLIRLLHGVQATAELEWLEDELWLLCAARMDREVKALRKRVERIRSNTAEEVDRRMKRLTSPAESGGHHSGDHGRKRGRRP